MDLTFIVFGLLLVSVSVYFYMKDNGPTEQKYRIVLKPQKDITAFELAHIYLLPQYTSLENTKEEIESILIEKAGEGVLRHILIKKI